MSVVELDRHVIGEHRPHRPSLTTRRQRPRATTPAAALRTTAVVARRGSSAAGVLAGAGRVSPICGLRTSARSAASTDGRPSLGRSGSSGRSSPVSGTLLSGVVRLRLRFRPPREPRRRRDLDGPLPVLRRVWSFRFVGRAVFLRRLAPGRRTLCQGVGHGWGPFS